MSIQSISLPTRRRLSWETSTVNVQFLPPRSSMTSLLKAPLLKILNISLFQLLLI